AWHHLCITQETDISASLQLYIDGEATGIPATMLGGAGEVSAIGKSDESYFNGIIDDVRIYSRVLSSSEIELMAAGEELAFENTSQTLTSNLDINGDLNINGGKLDISSNNYDLTL